MRDIEAGRVLRTLRLRRGWTQRQVATAADVSQSTVSKVERGRLGTFSLDTLRRLFATLDASADVLVRWRGGELDRLVDRRHAALVESTVQRLRAAGWLTLVEVSYAVFGERGSIDILALDARTLTLLVVEVKSGLTAVEATLRKLDEKVRLAPGIAERHGWRPTTVARLLVLPATTTSRRRLRDHVATFASVLPTSPATMRRWLRAPAGGASGVLLVPSSRGSDRWRGSSSHATTDRPVVRGPGWRNTTSAASSSVRALAGGRGAPATGIPDDSSIAPGTIWRDSRSKRAE